MHATGGHAWSVGWRTHRPARGRRPQEPAQRPLLGPDPFLVRVIDFCLLGLLFVAPLLMGGRHPVGQCVWLMIAAVLAVATLLHYRPSRPTPGDWIWLTAAGLVTLQLVPLNPALLTWLNPGIGDLLPGIAHPSQIPFGRVLYTDRPISINPYRTRLALGMLLAYGVIFHAVVRRVQTTEDIRRLLSWMAVAAVAVATLALAQRFAGNGKFLWVYQHVSRSASDAVKGPFQNQNHLAQLMALALGPLFYFATARTVPWKAAVASAGTTLCLLTGLLTFSRGGVLAIAAANLVVFAGFASTGRIGRRHWLRAIAPAILTVVLLAVWGGQKLWASVASLTEGTDVSTVSPARWELWQAHLRAIAASPWVGYGAASHEDIYPAFIEKDFGVKFTHGESGYLPIQLENGIAGSVLLACAFCLFAYWAWRGLHRPSGGKTCDATAASQVADDSSALAVACLAGLVASAVQSLGDFVWYIPACLTPVLLLLAILYRISSMRKESDLSADRSHRAALNIPWLAVPGAVLIAAVTWSIGPARGSHLWDRYRMLAREEATEAVTEASPGTEPSHEAILLLSHIVQRDPQNPVPRLRLAAELLKSLQNQRPQTETSQAEIVTSALRQSIKALRCTPFRSDGYLWLARGCHHAGGTSATSLALLEQAVRVRPNDTAVHYQAGMTAFQIGQPQWGIRAWKPVVEVPTPERNRILHTLTHLLPADFLLQSFTLDRVALSKLYHHSRSAATVRPDLTNRIARHLIERLIEDSRTIQDPVEAAALLNRASSLLEKSSGRPEEVIRLATEAVNLLPTEFRYRIRLINLLIAAKRWEEARQHIRWCQARKPRDPQVARQEERLLQGMIQR